MPTFRSEFNIEQFEEVLQKQAHEIAIDAVENLNQGDVRITIYGKRFSVVETNKVKIRFYANHVSYHEEPTTRYEDWWGFDAEEKIYSTSSHSTKISYFAPNKEKEKEVIDKITAFINKLMTEASIKSIPRFSLAQHTK